MSKTIFRTEKNPDNPFVMIDRRPIENPNLSWKAKGILAYLLSRPDNWIVRLGDLVKRSPDGVSSIRSALKELTKQGHITRREERENGRFKQYVLIVHELPSPLTGFTQAEKPQAENRTLNNNDSNDNDNNNIYGSYEPKTIEQAIYANKPVTQAMLNNDGEKKDMANLIGMGMGVLASDGASLAYAFMDERNIIIPQSKAKGQRKILREMIEMGVKVQHIRQAVKDLTSKGMTVVDLYSVAKTATDLANKPEKKEEKTRLL